MSPHPYLPPVMRPTPPAEDVQRRRSGRLAAADEHARLRARAGLNAAVRLTLAGAMAAGLLARSAGPAAAEPDATFTVTNANDDGPGSLRQALIDANLTTTADTIVFASSLSGQTITLSSGRMNIDESVSIIGPGPQSLTINANGYDQIFDIYSDSKTLNVTISGLTLTGASTTLGGGAISNWDENLTVDNVVLTANNAAYGAAIYHEGPDGELTIKNSVITDNIADIGGGGIAVNIAADLLIQDSVITGNEADSEGGGVSLSMEYAGHTAVIERCVISDNTVVDPDFGTGGGVYIFQIASPVTLRQSTLSGNQAEFGGGVYLLDNYGSLEIQNATLSGNTATAKGGGIFIAYNHANGGEINIEHTTIVGNRANDVNDSGGGVYTMGNDAPTDDPPTVINHSIIANNLSNNGAQANDIDNNSTAATVKRYNLRYSLFEAAPKPQNNYLIAGNIYVDPQLGDLADNGGAGMTHMPNAGSPVINAGDPFFAMPPYIDQRGVYRLIGARIDIGAVERGATLRLPFLVRSGALLNGLLSALFDVWKFWR